MHYNATLLLKIELYEQVLWKMKVSVSSETRELYIAAALPLDLVFLYS